MAERNKVGDQWGALEVIELVDELTTTTKNGVTDTFTSTLYKMRCKCGNLKTVPVGNFPGRRKMRDCGCGIAKIDHAHPRSSYMSEPTWRGVQKFAEEREMSASRAIGDLCQIALNVMEDEQVVKGKGQSRTKVKGSGKGA